MICLTFEYEVSWISFGYWMKMKTHSASEGSASLWRRLWPNASADRQQRWLGCKPSIHRRGARGSQQIKDPSRGGISSLKQNNLEMIFSKKTLWIRIILQRYFYMHIIKFNVKVDWLLDKACRKFRHWGKGHGTGLDLHGANRRSEQLGFIVGGVEFSGQFHQLLPWLVGNMWYYQWGKHLQCHSISSINKLVDRGCGVWHLAGVSCTVGTKRWQEITWCQWWWGHG